MVISPFALVLTCLLLTPLSGDPSPYVKRFEARYRGARLLQAAFLESYTENGRLVRMEAGTVFFRRPGKMRWEYESPEKNLFLVDGKTAWFYVPADHTVTRVPARQSTDWRTPLALLAGEMKVSRVCAKVAPAVQERPKSPDNFLFSCVLRGAHSDRKPAQAESFDAPGRSDSPSVFFEIVRDSGELVRVLIRDKGGITVEFQFSNWRMDPPMDESLFHFSPPLGVAIVDGFAAQNHP
jgi:outer membrane lipoprotein carrier protein